MDELLDLAKCPPASIHADASVRDAAMLLVEQKVGALVVLDGSKLVGIVSERDIVRRVVAVNLDPDAARVAEIMTREVRTIAPTDTSEVAIAMMLAGHFRHLPILDEHGVVLGMLSVRHLLRVQVGELSRRNADLVNFISADGPGG